MKKIVTICLVIALAAGCLAGCGSANSNVGQDSDKLQIVAICFPEYDWVREILGEGTEHMELTLLLDKGADLHSYQPTAKDMMKISTCDLLLYVGGESDAWVKDALQEAVNQDMVTLNLMDLLGDSVKEEEVIEGMQGYVGESGDEEEEIEYDEHVWLSLRNAKLFCEAIADSLSVIDPQHEENYRANASDYETKLDELDGAYRMAVEAGTVKTLLFADRFPFRYLADDDGLDYYAAFEGCSAETEASFETIIFLSEKVDALSLPAILTIEGSDLRMAETIRNNTKAKDQQILILHSMQSVSATDVAKGTTYLSVMEQNLNVIKEALR